MRRTFIAALALLTVFGVACSSGGSSGGDEPFPDEGSEVTVRVANSSGIRVTVAISWAGTPALDLGIVQSGSEETFTTPHEPGYAQFVIDYAARATAQSSRITPRPGDELLLTIRSQFDITVDRVNQR